MKNPFEVREVTVIGESPLILPFTNYLSESIEHCGDLPGFHLDMLSWLVLPYGISLLHVFCYFENHKLVKTCLINNCRYTLTLQNESPLSIAINRQSFACIEVIAKYIGGTYKTNPEVYKSIENELVKLNKASPASLVDFYDSAFAVQTGLPGYGSLKKRPSYERFSLTPGIDPSLFIGSGTNEHRIQFKSMLFRLNSTMGSTQSMSFMKSLIESTNREVFRTSFIQGFLAYKWGRIKKFIWLRSCLDDGSYTLFHTIFRDD